MRPFYPSIYKNFPVSLSMDAATLERLDKLAAERYAGSRSAAVRDMIDQATQQQPQDEPQEEPRQ